VVGVVLPFDVSIFGLEGFIHAVWSSVVLRVLQVLQGLQVL
jgi:hypothetical protein